MRSGFTHGILLPMRMSSTCGIARRRLTIHSSAESVRVSGSPPLSRTSRISRARRCSRWRAAAPRAAAPVLAHLALASAEAAVHGAGVRDHEQHAVGIAVREVRHRHVVFLVERIVFQEVRVLELPRVRHLLQEDRVAGVPLLDQIQVVGRGEEGVFLGDGLELLVLLLGEAGNLTDVSHALGELLLPLGAGSGSLVCHGSSGAHAAPAPAAAVAVRVPAQAYETTGDGG